MTLSSIVNKDIYAGNGAQREWPMTFPVDGVVGGEIEVYKVDEDDITTLLSANYEVNLTTLMVTYPTIASGLDVLNASEQIILLRKLPHTQLIDYKNQGTVPAETIEQGLDRLTMLTSQLNEEVSRCVQAELTEDDADDYFVTLQALVAEAEAQVVLATAQAAQAAISAAASQGVSGTFVDGDLVAGVLTITHNLGLSSPFQVDFSLVDNNQQEFDADSITFLTNTIEVDISSYGTISGTYGYLYGGSPTTTITVPDPTGEAVADQLRVNAAQDAYETFTPEIPTAVGETVADQLRVNAAQTAMEYFTPDVRAWPVGSVFIGVVATNPNSLLGYGTWIAFGTGRVLVGIDAGDADFDTAEETGGAKTVTLDETMIPAHEHEYYRWYNGTASGAGPAGTAANTLELSDSETIGGGLAHNNVQPYLVVHMWKRTV